MTELDPRAAAIVANPAAGLNAIADLPFEEQHPLVRAALRVRMEIISNDAMGRWCRRNAGKMMALLATK